MPARVLPETVLEKTNNKLSGSRIKNNSEIFSESKKINKMKRTKLKIKLGIDLAMIAAFLVNIFTGFAIFFGFVAGGGRQYGGFTGFNAADISTLSAKAWYRFLHDWTGILIVVLALIHLGLNWNTLWCYFRNLVKSSRTVKAAKSDAVITTDASCGNI